MTEEKTKNQIIKELKEEIHNLKKLVVKDELTEVFNRRGLINEVGNFFNEIVYLRSHSSVKRTFNIEDLSLIFIDLDDFKKINDEYGHFAGDMVLRWLASEIQRKIRRIDMIGRWGGDEFVVALIGTGEEGAFKRAEVIRKHICSKKISEKYPKLRVAASFGVVSVKKSKAKNVEQLITAADKAMYMAKLINHKNCVIKYSDIKGNLMKKYHKK